VSRSPYAAHGRGDGQSHLLRSRGNGWEAIDRWGEQAALRRMPYALAALPGQPGRLLVGLRGGSMLLGDEAGTRGRAWSRASRTCLHSRSRRHEQALLAVDPAAKTGTYRPWPWTGLPRARLTMDRNELRRHIESAAPHGGPHATRLASLILGACWPGGPADRTERAALEWLRRGAPPLAGTELPVCSCSSGRCVLCN
jgi:hypothetical protein